MIFNFIILFSFNFITKNPKYKYVSSGLIAGFCQTIVETPAEQMSDIDMEKLHKALILSERTMYLKKQLAKIDKKAEKQWNKLRKMYNKNDETWVRDLDIMPKHWAIAVQNCDYDQLSFTIKHLLRASYDNNTNRFAGQHMLYGPKLKTMSEIEV